MLNRKKSKIAELTKQVENLRSIIQSNETLFVRIKNTLWNTTIEGVPLGENFIYYTPGASLIYWLDSIDLARQARIEKEKIIAIVQEEISKKSPENV